jgi:hypothetical protein
MGWWYSDKKTETKAVLGLSHEKGQKKQTQIMEYSEEEFIVTFQQECQTL